MSPDVRHWTSISLIQENLAWNQNGCNLKVNKSRSIQPKVEWHMSVGNDDQKDKNFLMKLIFSLFRLQARHKAWIWGTQRLHQRLPGSTQGLPGSLKRISASFKRLLGPFKGLLWSFQRLHQLAQGLPHPKQGLLQLEQGLCKRLHRRADEGKRLPP